MPPRRSIHLGAARGATTGVARGVRKGRGARDAENVDSIVGSDEPSVEQQGSGVNVDGDRETVLPVAGQEVELESKLFDRFLKRDPSKFVGADSLSRHSTRLDMVLRRVLQLWKIPVSVLLKLTIPETSPSEWNRFYQSANVALCPLALLYSCKSFMALDHPISFLLPNIHFPLWSVVLIGSCSLATLHYLVEKGPPKTEQLPTVLVAFVMSVFWISTVAGELLNCLEALGIILKLPASLLGLTVLAWGNSVGDLVAVAKAGQPVMAMAGCFAGPMFNMLFGLGAALVIQTADVFPEAYELHFHVSIVVASSVFTSRVRLEFFWI